MEHYDPRNPIIKATENESDEVEGHRFIDKADGPEELTLRATGDGGGDNEVEGHRFIDKADGPDELTLRATGEDSGDDEVEGRRFIKETSDQPIDAGH